jgi:tetratricopeptide (TPR) repeat protein
MAALSEVLRDLMRRAGVGAQTLSKLTGVPRTAIDNWREGTVRRPRHWRPLLQIARVLSLSQAQTDELLQSAGYPVTATLAQQTPITDPDRQCLALWLSVPGSGLGSRHQLRAATAVFTGRADALAALTGLLRGPGGLAGIRGMGGVGKTELALLAASQTAGSYPDGQLLVDLAGVLSPERALQQVITAFGEVPRPGDDLRALQRRYCAVLAGRKVLILADDVTGPAQARPLLPPPGSALLITTRHRFTLPGMLTVDLEPLPRADAVRLLRDGPAGPAGLSGPHAAALAHACGYLPLALQVCAGLLANDPTLTAAGLITQLSGPDRLAQLSAAGDEQADVSAVLDRSYHRLSEPARSFFRCLGVLAADFPAELAGAVTLAGEAETDRLLRDLAQRNLLGYDPLRRRWRLHDLLAGLARYHLTESGEEETVSLRYAEAAVRLAGLIEQRYETDAPGALAWFDQERPHLDAARRWAAGQAGSPGPDRLLVTGARATFQQIGFSRYDRGQELRPWLEQAVLAAGRLGDSGQEVLLRNRLGQVLLDLGETAAAIVHFEHQHRLAGRLGQARALNNLGIAHLRRGEPGQAIDAHLRQCEIVRELGDRAGEAMARGNLGRAYVCLGQVREGLAELGPALELTRRLGLSYGEGAVLHHIGVAHLAAGDALRAVSLLEQALTISRAMNDRHGESRILTDLASATVVLGQPHQGLKHAKAALACAGEAGTAQAKAEALLALAQARMACGERAAGWEGYRRAMVALRRVGAAGGVAECQWQLGWALLEEKPAHADALLASAVAYYHRIGHRRAGQRAELATQRLGGPGKPRPAQDPHKVVAQP